MLVIAAPHSKCKGPERDCDLDAKKITLALSKKARAVGIKTEVCLSDKYRHEIDNNRIESRGYPFRKALDKALRTNGVDRKSTRLNSSHPK